MASCPIISWQIEGEKMETVTDFLNSLSMVTAALRRLLLGRIVMTNLESVLRSRAITLLTKINLVKNYGFSSSYVWM